MPEDPLVAGGIYDTMQDGEPIKEESALAKEKPGTGGKSARRSKKKSSRKGHKPIRKRNSEVSQRVIKLQTAAFFRFMRALRQRHRYWDSAKLAMFGAEAWCKMSVSERMKYSIKRKRRVGKKSKRERSRSGKGKGRSGSKGRRSRSHKSKARRGVKCA